MKVLAISVVLGLLVGAPVLAESMHDTENCVIVYMKNDASQPNLTIACDGERVLTQTIKTDDKVVDKKKFLAALFQDFQFMVNPENDKVCTEYNYENAWWASCLTVK